MSHCRILSEFSWGERFILSAVWGAASLLLLLLCVLSQTALSHEEERHNGLPKGVCMYHRHHAVTYIMSHGEKCMKGNIILMLKPTYFDQNLNVQIWRHKEATEWHKKPPQKQTTDLCFNAMHLCFDFGQRSMDVLVMFKHILKCQKTCFSLSSVNWYTHIVSDMCGNRGMLHFFNFSVWDTKAKTFTATKDYW